MGHKMVEEKWLHIPANSFVHTLLEMCWGPGGTPGPRGGRERWGSSPPDLVALGLLHPWATLPVKRPTRRSECLTLTLQTLPGTISLF